jgi:hypothetical protein
MGFEGEVWRLIRQEELLGEIVIDEAGARGRTRGRAPASASSTGRTPGQGPAPGGCSYAVGRTPHVVSGIALIGTRNGVTFEVHLGKTVTWRSILADNPVAVAHRHGHDEESCCTNADQLPALLGRALLWRAASRGEGRPWRRGVMRVGWWRNDLCRSDRR